jgi:hypothetical protein
MHSLHAGHSVRVCGASSACNPATKKVCQMCDWKTSFQSVKLLRMIDKAAVEIGTHGVIDVCDVGNFRCDIE